MMSAREDRRLLSISIAFIVGLVAIGIIVANIRYLDLGEGSPGLGPEIREIAMALMYALAIIWGIVFLIYLLRRKPGRRVQEAKEPGRGNFIVTLVILGVLFLVIFTVNQSQSHDQNQPSPDPDPSPNGTDQNPVSSDATGWTGALYVLVGVLAAALVIAALKHNRSTPLRLRKAQLALAQQNATETIRQAVLDLFAGEDPRSVIIRTYQQMSRLLGQGGRRLEPLTPREVAELAKHDLGWPEGPLIELTTLFEEAWYSEHAMGDAERDRALRAFEAIVSKDDQRRLELGRVDT
jgi:NADH:ubiquinone oxidoreductase subunit 6 (subunit J)